MVLLRDVASRIEHLKIPRRHSESSNAVFVDEAEQDRLRSQGRAVVDTNRPPAPQR